MDEGQPISYLALSHHVPVFASDGTEVGSVDHVVAAPAEDIFHGIVMKVPTGSISSPPRTSPRCTSAASI